MPEIPRIPNPDIPPMQPADVGADIATPALDATTDLARLGLVGGGTDFLTEVGEASRPDMTAPADRGMSVAVPDQAADSYAIDPTGTTETANTEEQLPAEAGHLGSLAVAPNMEKPGSEAVPSDADSMAVSEVLPPEQSTLIAISKGMADMGVDLEAVLPDRPSQQVAAMIRAGQTYEQMGDQLGVDAHTVGTLVKGVVGLVAAKMPEVVTRLAGEQQVEAPTPTPPKPATPTTHRWGRGEVPVALEKIMGMLDDKGRAMTEFLPIKASTLRAAAPLFAEGLDDDAVAERLGVKPSSVSGLRTRLVDTLLDHVPADVIEPGAMPAPQRVAKPHDHVGARVNGMIREANLTPGQIAKELGISQPRMSRFLTGQTQPLADEVLVPVLQRLGASPEVIEQLKAMYGSGRGKTTNS